MQHSVHSDRLNHSSSASLKSFNVKDFDETLYFFVDVCFLISLPRNQKETTQTLKKITTLSFLAKQWKRQYSAKIEL